MVYLKTVAILDPVCVGLDLNLSNASTDRMGKGYAMADISFSPFLDQAGQ
jgi:hypothetical protein